MIRVERDALPMTHAAWLVRAVRPIVATVSNAWLRFWRTRTAMRQLSDMTEAQLADIGLTRCDVDRVALRVPRDKATQTLEEIARARSASCDDGAPLRLSNPMQA